MNEKEKYIKHEVIVIQINLGKQSIYVFYSNVGKICTKKRTADQK